MNERERKKETLNFYDLFMKTIEKKNNNNNNNYYNSYKIISFDSIIGKMEIVLHFRKCFLFSI